MSEKRRRRKDFAPGDAVEAQREPDGPWLPCSYVKPVDVGSRTRHHLVRGEPLAHYIDSMTGFDVPDPDRNSRACKISTAIVPSQRIRAARGGSETDSETDSETNEASSRDDDHRGPSADAERANATTQTRVASSMTPREAADHLQITARSASTSAIDADAIAILLDHAKRLERTIDAMRDAIESLQAKAFPAHLDMAFVAH